MSYISYVFCLYIFLFYRTILIFWAVKIIDNSFVTTTNEIFQTISEELQTEYTGRKIQNDFFT